MSHIPFLSEEEFCLFQNYIVEESGLHFDPDQSPQLRLSLWDRLRATGCHSYREYYQLLKSVPKGHVESRVLLEALLTGETYFFRSQAQFDALMHVVLPEIIEKKKRSGDKSLRVWSAGCSKGDETYSIAIAIMETLPDYQNWNLSILGTDLNRNALAVAKEAIYEPRDCGHAYPEYIHKYLTKTNLGYVLDDAVKKIPRFEYHNLAKDLFALEGMERLDLIFCRNVTIYFDFSVTQTVIDKFYDCLAVGGFLFLGHAETLWQITDKFEALEFPQTFIYKKPLHAGSVKKLPPAVYVPEIKFEELTVYEQIASPNVAATVSETDNKVMEMKQNLSAAARLFEKGLYHAAFELIEQIHDEDLSPTSKNIHFSKAKMLANMARYQDAIDTLEKIVAIDNLYMEAYYLLGVVSLKMNKVREAEEQFRKVIYIDSRIDIAYFNLGNIYLSQKKFDRAALEYENALKILRTKNKDESIIFCEEYTVEFLMRACQNNFEEMSRQGWKGSGGGVFF